MSDDLALALERVSIEGTGPKKVNSTVTMVRLKPAWHVSLDLISKDGKAI
jgi:hypothetical protein